MPLNSLRTPWLASFSLGTLLGPAFAQQNLAAPGGTPVVQAAAKDSTLDGLPGFLLPVPGGAVEMGLDVDQLIAAVCQATSPDKPQLALKLFQPKLQESLQRSLRMLGRKKVAVEPFLLAKWPVKNSEYETYLAAHRQKGIKLRPPFHWWRYGRADDYKARIPEINQLYPGQEGAVHMFWESQGKDLPYELKDDKGNSIVDFPVSNITWRDANTFAGWLGMRLPTEAEWTRAARGDGTHVWPSPTLPEPAADIYSEALLKRLGLFAGRDRTLKKVGTVAGQAGPYGHLDLHGQVWQMTGQLGYQPISSPELFQAEWKKLQKDKIGSLASKPPEWLETRLPAKGGSYLSADEPMQLAIDSRVGIETTKVADSVGFRLAKSLRPGFDAMFSMLRGTHDKSLYGIDQDTDLGLQVGTERYELGADGFPTDYAAVSFAPMNWLSKDKNPDLGKLLEASQRQPVLIGTLVTTVPLHDPLLQPGIYSVLFRRDGLPKELADSIKLGHKELAAAAKKAKTEDKDGDKAAADNKGEKDDKADSDDKKKKVSPWREVIRRYGLTEEDVAKKDAADGNVPFIRVDGIEVPTNDDCFLFFGNEGKVVSLRTKAKKPEAAPAAGGSIQVADDGKGKALATLSITAPLAAAAQKKYLGFTLQLLLDRPAPTADKPWRGL
jgi:formylglycine-generating enzyme required for sulfatase activity